MFNYTNLRGRIIEKFGSIKAFAQACNLSATTISKKINGKASISSAEVAEWAKPELLDIQPCECYAYFFVA